MASGLAGSILNMAIKEMMNKEGAAYTLGYLESVLARALDDTELNKVNKLMVDAVLEIA
jgi:hypothetical protein